MRWPDVLDDMRARIDVAVIAAGYDQCPVYLGRFKRVPNKDAIYIYRGDGTPEDNLCPGEITPVFVAIWTRAEHPTGAKKAADDVSSENAHVLASWQRLAAISQVVLNINWQGVGYNVDYINRLTDNSEFHPSAGEQLEFKTRYGTE